MCSCRSWAPKWITPVINPQITDTQQPGTNHKQTPDNKEPTTTTDTRQPGTNYNHRQRNPTTRNQLQPPILTHDTQEPTTTTGSDSRQPGTNYNHRDLTTRNQLQPLTPTPDNEQSVGNQHQHHNYHQQVRRSDQKQHPKHTADNQQRYTSGKPMTNCAAKAFLYCPTMN
jgi:hypothetical protein